MYIINICIYAQTFTVYISRILMVCYEATCLWTVGENCIPPRKPMQSLGKLIIKYSGTYQNNNKC